MVFKFAGIRSQNDEQRVTIGLAKRSETDIALTCFDEAGHEIMGGTLVMIHVDDGKLKISLPVSIRKDLPVHRNALGQITID